MTKTDFQKYLRVQKSGITNMFDIVVVKAMSRLSEKKIIDIMTNYGTYLKKFGDTIND